MTNIHKRYYDCIVIGGGAAGLFCAANTGQRGKTVAVLDHANKVGKKILMSGGGRCNFTNYSVEPDNYLCSNPHFCKSALSRYTQYDFLALVHKYDIAYHEKTLGQLFCDNKAKDILNALLTECDEAGVSIRTGCAIEAVNPLPEASETPAVKDTNPQARFTLATSEGLFACHSLVIATGGLSIPTMGATGFGYDIAKQFGLKIKPRVASLVPFTFDGEALNCFQSLAGLSLPVNVHCNNQSFSEGLLFTHKGLSGPAILQISNYWNPEDQITLNFLPSESLIDCIEQWRESSEKSELKNLLSRHLPKRFVSAWFAFNTSISSLANKTVFDLSHAELAQLDHVIHRWTCIPKGTEGYKTAEVTRGGVDTDGISSKTFESKTTPGLFFIGEVLDVTGWLGGFNFQWAWASGYCAAGYV